MNRIAKFEKVSLEQFSEDWQRTVGRELTQTDEELLQYIKEMYEDIKLPARATSGSAGYDFFAPRNFQLLPGQTATIPTGIRVSVEPDWALWLLPRSGLGFKYRLQIDNTVGIIDSDYYHSDNEGHIFVKITNDSKQAKSFTITKGDGFCQGIFLPYGITLDDRADGVRNGGFGSTTK